MDAAIVAHNEIVYWMKLQAVQMDKSQFKEWKESNRIWLQSFYDCGHAEIGHVLYDVVVNRLDGLTMDQSGELSNWLLVFAKRMKLNKNFKELV